MTRWYAIVERDESITQGDIILDCPLIGWKPDANFSLSEVGEAETLKGAVTAVRADAIVMTQACDLEHEKVLNALLCPHTSLTNYREQWELTMEADGQSPTDKAWRRQCDRMKDGYMWNLAMLDAPSQSSLPAYLRIGHRIVEFSEAHTAPVKFLEALLNARGRKRLRLLPPYREHLSQAFARFFMRVGLPNNITKAW